MSYCAKCPRPGNCCREFVLNMPLRYEEVDKWLASAGLGHFYAISEHSTFGEGDMYFFRFGCTKRTMEGRCAIYEDRPKLCREFQPGSDVLCVLPSN